MSQRPATAVLVFPLLDLRQPQVLIAPELAAAGITIEVVAPDDVPSFGDQMPPELRARVREQAPHLLDRPETFFAVRMSELIDVDLLDAAGQRLSLGGGTQHGADGPALRYWTTEEQPWLLNGMTTEAHPERAVSLEVRVPVRFEPRSADDLMALREAIAELLPEEAPALLARFRPAVRAVAHGVDDYESISLGASRLNGRPDVPSGFEWPTYEDSTGIGPLTFIAQINLADLPEVPGSSLPSDGWLLFFADVDRSMFQGPDEQRAQRVLCIPGDVELAPKWPPWRNPLYARVERPNGSIIGYGRPASLTFEIVESAPYDDLYELLHQDPSIDELARTELHDLLYASKAARDWHQLGGLPNSVQYDPFSGALGSAGIDVAEATNWQLLFQCASDWPLDLLWGDVGKLYFVIESARLAQRDFSGTLVEFQCS